MSIIYGVPRPVGAVRTAQTSQSVGGLAPPVAGATHEKTGVVVADTLAGATDVFEAVEAGTATADTLAAATDVLEAVESGTVTSATKVTGADVFTATEAGTAVADTLLSGASLARYPAAVLADLPSLYWRLNEPSGGTAADFTGNGRTGTITGATYGVAGASGDADTAMTLDASTGRVKMDANLQLGTGTIELWLNMPSLPAGNGVIATYNEADDTATFDKTLFVQSDGSLRFYTYTGAENLTPSPTTKMVADRWYHVVATMDGTTNRLYLDGVEVANILAGASYTGYTVPRWSLGHDGNTIATETITLSRLNASRDEGAVYTSVLSPTRVLAHYNAVSGAIAKTGAFVAGTKAAATDVYEAVETGVATSATKATGADVFQAVEAGLVVADTLVAGPSSVSNPGSNTGYGDDAYGSGSYGVRTQGALTYDKSGAVVADTLATGTDVFEATDTGKAVAGTKATGTDVFEAVEAGIAAAATLATGADVFTAAETGTATADTVLAGDQQFTLNRSGTATADTLALAADVFEAVETGAAVADTTATGADSMELPSDGTAVAGTKATGADAATFAESGTTAADTTATGTDTFEAVESGTATADTTLAGVSEKQLAGKAGTATAGSVLKGADVFEAVRAGVATSQTKVSGSDVFTATETGAAVALTLVTGTEEFVYGGDPPPVTHPPLGGVFDETSTNGTVRDVARNGTVVEYQRSGVVVTYSRGGVVVAKVRSGRVVEHPRNGTPRQVVRAGSHDESSTGGEVL